MSETVTAEKLPKRIPPNTIRMQAAGDLILVKCPDQKWQGFFKKFETLFEFFANMERSERLLNYKFITGLILTSHAKKTNDKDFKRKLFDLKNAIFINIANSDEYRKKLAYLYLTSPKPRVLKFCDDCNRRNTEAGLPPHNWEHCDNCQVDHKFYNLLSIHHKFHHGSVTLFLSQDQMEKIKGSSNYKVASRHDFEEEGIYQKFRYNVRNLDSFVLDDAIKVQAKLLKT